MADLFDTTQYFFNPYSLPPFAAATGLLFVLLQFCVHGAVRCLRVPLALALLAATIWLLSFHLMYSSKSEQSALVWAKAAYLGVPFICAATYDLSVRLSDLYDAQRPVVWMSWFASLLFAALAFNSELISGVTKHWWGFYPLYGRAGVVFVTYFGTMAAVSLWHVHRAYQAAESYERKRMVQFIGFGILTGYLAAVDFVPKLGAPLYPFGYFWILISALFLSQGIAERAEARPAAILGTRPKTEAGYGRRLQRQQSALLCSLEVLMTDRSAAERIRPILEEAADATMVDRMAVWQYDPVAGILQSRHLYRRISKLHRVIVGQIIHPDPAYLEPLIAGSTLPVDNLAMDDRMAVFRTVYLDDAAVLVSTLEVPIRLDGRLLGVLSSHAVGKSREWRDDERQFLQLIAEILACIFDTHIGPSAVLGHPAASPKVRRVMEHLIARWRRSRQRQEGE